MAVRAFYSLRQYFSEEQIVSLAVDASRIGGLQRMVSFVCRPDGYGCWLPPQASNQQKTPEEKSKPHLSFRKYSVDGTINFKL
eukprot:1956410-Amphidinium_carterae.1